MNVIITQAVQQINIPADIEETITLAMKTMGELYAVTDAEVSITFTDDEHIWELNKKYRGIDRPTDVLSFALNESEEPEIIGDFPNVLGDIVISLPRAEAQAEAYGHSVKREIVFLAVHGMLHLLGYDHMEEAERSEMEQEQRIVMEKLNLPR